MTDWGDNILNNSLKTFAKIRVLSYKKEQEFCSILRSLTIPILYFFQGLQTLPWERKRLSPAYMTVVIVQPHFTLNTATTEIETDTMRNVQ